MSDSGGQLSWRGRREREEARALAAAARAAPPAAGGDRPLPARTALDAAVDVVAEKGYAATTVADLTKEAGISRTTFYAMFEDKEACFLAAYDAAVDVLVAPRRDRLREPRTPWPARVRAGARGAALLARRRARSSPASPWSTSARPGLAPSAATAPRCSG